ncbi:DedA family protein [Haloprofundus halophilus]|uniref:DedA family protein n=1 Tax=Haloprofundus halophilus TaxID=2283527 RepID=UPI000E43AD67|nr:DedA family protein [Haloprofundus halophilus]
MRTRSASKRNRHCFGRDFYGWVRVGDKNDAPGARTEPVPSGLTQTALDLVAQYGYLAIFVFTFLESSMLFPLLPSEVVLPVGAGLIVTGAASFALFVAATTAGVVVGSVVAYRFFGEKGHDALEAHGGAVDVSERRLAFAQRWFEKWGEGSVLWGRLLPVLRSVISLPAGFAGMRMWKFLFYTAVGGLMFNVAVAAVVYYGRQQSVYHVASEILRTQFGRLLGVASANPALSAVFVLAAVTVAVVTWRTVERAANGTR